MILLVRHAVAVSRRSWGGDEGQRPLTPRGRRQAGSLVEMLRSVPIDRVVVSPTSRCTATVAPLAKARRRLVPRASKRLREGNGDRALELLLATEDDVLFCTHGDVVETILEGLRPLGWPIPLEPRRAKGSVWLLSQESARYLPPGA